MEKEEGEVRGKSGVRKQEGGKAEARVWTAEGRTGGERLGQGHSERKLQGSQTWKAPRPPAHQLLGSPAPVAANLSFLELSVSGRPY